MVLPRQPYRDQWLLELRLFDRFVSLSVVARLPRRLKGVHVKFDDLICRHSLAGQIC